MAEKYKSYRIRTEVGENAPNVINVHLDQTYESFEILSLKIDSKNAYNLYQSDKGVIVGRVLANGGFGVPNAKISIFIPTDEKRGSEQYSLYPYSTVNDLNYDRVRYNLLPDSKDEACYQNVGTFPHKRLVLDNDDVIEVFDKYWKYTTVSNTSGDYMMYGIPVGNHTLHVDIDLSDIGLLSQRPRDMIYKGYDVNLFESPNKFKQDTNLNSLSQIKSQDIGVDVFPFWGDSSNSQDDIAITRCDIQVDYKFEPTCIFIGSIITDSGSNAIGKNCAGTDKLGKMSELIAGEGRIEMIRKTIDNKVEEYQIKGNRLIDGDGVWCYQIPMNLDYVMTDEFGNLVPTDSPNKGIPTRARVRFRISLDETPSDVAARKRCRYLVPNNPREDAERFPNFVKTHMADYEFGTNTADESYCDLFWNKVYTVKNYIPRLQKKTKVTDRRHTGIKLINHYEGNNPMPYNNLSIKLSFQYRFICVLTKIFIELVTFLNGIITLIGAMPCILYKLFSSVAKFFRKMRIKIKAFGKTLINICLGCPIASVFQTFADVFHAIIPSCIAISSEFCNSEGANTHSYTYYPGCGKFLDVKLGSYIGCAWDVTKERHNNEQAKLDKEDRTVAQNKSAELKNCVETELAESNDATSFNFQNDWVNGTLYAPLWFRKITTKKTFLFGLVKRKGKDEWCTSSHNYHTNLKLYQPCAVKRDAQQPYMAHNGEYNNAQYMGSKAGCETSCHKRVTYREMGTGVILAKETMLGQTVYYYKSVEYGGEDKPLKILFATDIVLLGSLNDFDLDGVPQFFKSLESTTYKLPTDMLFTDNDVVIDFDADGKAVKSVVELSHTEMTGNDWGNSNDDLCDKHDGGLFYSIGCSTIDLEPKSCINLSRICEFGVSLDETKLIYDLEKMKTDETGNNSYDTLIPDGFISKDELYNDDWRSMFATLNGNELKTKINKENGLKEYDFRHLYVDNFDSSLYTSMKARQKKCKSDITYRNNYQFETFSAGYYDFRMGKNPTFYDERDNPNGHTFPRYENSFYFYFGLTPGKTAIDKFNSQFFSECENPTVEDIVRIEAYGNTWCSDASGETRDDDGYVKIDLSNVSLPCDIVLTNQSVLNQDNEQIQYTLSGINEEKIVIGTKWWDTHEQEREGYTLIKDPVSILNGRYRIVIIDSEGTMSETHFDMFSKYLTFSVDATPFRQPDNVLEQKFHGNMVDIATDKTGRDCANLDRTIGGTLLIGNVMDNETNRPMDEFYIEIESTHNIGYPGYLDTGKFTLSFNGDEEPPDQDDHPSPYLCKTNGNYLIGVPKSNETYNVKITQLCNGVETSNITTVTVKVGQPTPFKMYINGAIDYDVISDWDTGWQPTGETNIVPFGVISPNWYNIGNTNGYHWEKYDAMKPDVDSMFEKIGYRQELTDSREEWDIYGGIDFYEGDTRVLLYDIQKNIDNYPSQEGVYYTFDEIIERLRNEMLSIDNGNGEGVVYSIASEMEVLNNLIAQCYEDINYNLQEIANIEEEIDNEELKENPDLEKIESLKQDKRAYENSNEAYNNEINVYNKDIEREKLNEENARELYSYDNDIIEYFTSIRGQQSDFVDNMRTTFQLICPDEEKTITISGVTDDMPLEFTEIYRPEVTLVEDTRNTLDKNIGKTNLGIIDNITIPSLTYQESEEYGNDDYIIDGTDYCYATDNMASFKESGKNPIKYPYFVGIKNSFNVSIPFELYNGNNYDYSKLFGFHIVDKIFKLNTYMWSCVDNIPYCLVEAADSDTRHGEYINMNGLYAGEILNGYITDIDSQGMTTFEEQTIGDNKIIVYTPQTSNNTEESLPTRRYIWGCKEIEEEVSIHRSFKNYKIISESNNDVTRYLPLEKDSVMLRVTDRNSCTNSPVVRGSMKITVQPELPENMDAKHPTLSLDVENNTGGNVMYYIYNITHTEDVWGNITRNTSKLYPLNYATKDSESEYYDIEYNDNESLDGVFDNDASHAKYLFTKNTNKNVLLTNVDKKVSSSIIDSNEKEIKTNGYGSTGVFENLKNDNTYYVVAVTDDNYYCISPAYMTFRIKAEAYVYKIITGVDNNNTVYDYKGVVVFNKDIDREYYLKWYDFNADLSVKYTTKDPTDNEEYDTNSSNSQISSAIIGGNTYDAIYVDIDEYLYERCKSVGIKEFRLKCTSTITDCTGFTHLVEVQNGQFKTQGMVGGPYYERYAITWNTNGGYWNTNLKGNSVYANGEGKELNDTDNRTLYIEIKGKYRYTPTGYEETDIRLQHIEYNVCYNNSQLGFDFIKKDGYTLKGFKNKEGVEFRDSIVVTQVGNNMQSDTYTAIWEPIN